MPSPYTAERHREPVYMDAAGSRRRFSPDAERPYRPRHEEPHPRHERRRRRAKTHDDPPLASSSPSPSPPPTHRRRRRAPSPAEDPYRPHRRVPRNEDYFSDNRHNRPRKDPYDDRVRDHGRGHVPRDKATARRADARPRTERKESKWEQQAKDMFKEYAVPAIKAEGTKYITKQIGNLLAKQAA